MSSFSSTLKKEVANTLGGGTDEALSMLSAVIKTSGEISIKDGKESVQIHTEIEEVANLIEKIIFQIYGETVEKQQIKSNFSNSTKYQITISSNIAKQVLLDTEVMQYDEEKYLQIVSGISPYFVQDENTELAFFKGVFVSVFSCNISVGDAKKRHDSGYHAEFVFSNKSLAQDFCFLLADFDIISKMTPRKNSFVVYVKGLDMICDMLATVGATQGMLALQNESVVRAVKNNVNRQNNCINANLTKTVDASVRELNHINFIQRTIGIDSLSQPLQDVCYLRLANPEESLDSLVKLSTKKISKSGLYHRLKNIEKIAKDLQKQYDWFSFNKFLKTCWQNLPYVVDYMRLNKRRFFCWS